MKQLYITDINKPTIFDDYLGQCMRIALKSISIRATWLNLFNDNDFTTWKATSNQLVNRIEIVKGLYRIKDLAAIINKQANGKAEIFVLNNGYFQLRVNDGFKVVINRTLQELLGLNDPIDGKNYTKGDYDVYYRTDIYQRLSLICPQLDEDDCLLDGKKSKILAMLPTKELNAWGDMIIWNFDTPVYLPLKGSTDRLEFLLTDHPEKNVAFTGILMQILIE